MNKKGTKALASATLMSLVLTTALATGNVKAATNGQATRVGGTDRYETAAKVATANFTTSDNVVLVSGEGYADSVSASVLAKKLNAPIVLTGLKTLDANAKSAIETLKAKNVYIIGGTGSISASIEDGLKSDYTVTRLGGQDRYATNLAIANKLVDLGVSKDNIIAVAGTGFADALSVAPVAATDNEILLLTNNNADTMKNTAEFAKDSNVTVVGTTNVVSDSIYNQLKADKRIDGGADRFATNIKVLNAFDSDLKADKLYVANATGNGYADALVASAIAGKYAAPLVLTDTEGSTATTNAVNYIGTKATKDTDLQVVGGTGVVSDATVQAIDDAVPKEPVFDGTVTSVETVADQYVNSKADDETLQFTVNGGVKATAQDIVDAGYGIEFSAFKNDNTTALDIFQTGGTTSKDGILDKTKLQNTLDPDGAVNTNDGVDNFKYSVKITKDGQIIGQTGLKTVNIVNGDKAADSLGDITIKQGDSGSTTTKITSGKFIKGETATVDKVKGNIDGASNVTISKDNLKYYSSNPFVASVTEDTGVITTHNAGTFALTVKSGSTSKAYNYTVTSDTSRKVTSATASVSSLKIGRGATTSFDLTLKDQLGDTANAKDQDIASGDSDFQISTPIKSGSDSIATVTSPVADDSTDSDGKVTVTVLADSTNSGNGSLKVYNKNGAIFTLPIEVTSDSSVDNIKVEAASNDEDSKDLTLDLNPKTADDNGDKYVKLNVNQYASNGTYLGKATAPTLTITTASGKKIVPASSTITPNSNGDFVIAIPSADQDDYGTSIIENNLVTLLPNGIDLNGISAVDTGTITVTAQVGSKTNSITLNVKDSTPSISSAKLTSGFEINKADGLSIKDILKASDISASISNVGDGKIRIGDDGTIFVKSDANVNTTGTVTDIDDSSIKYDPKTDITLGKIVVAGKTGVTGDYSFSNGKTDAITTTSTSGDKYITVGVQKVHADSPLVSVDVKVN
ncbi:cell wall-binding repeat-containing protein [Clostridium tyrobutyricum]|uniref:cell wall-binding repeat-containing protein n=1 Tax=Clostridium tyrobutyricum TaxID=1519 RepID=UPI00189E85B1|nr:cell wall-binding repeat-containing protein [Clostridium tyrobutyricum]